MSHWKPNTTLEILKCRAALLDTVREFFQQINTLEVDTPALSLSTTPDPNIESFTTQYNGQQYYLHTSPEFPMKRLLASGSGAIYQICKVFRQGEAGRNHNPEFTMIEWYQPGMSYHQLMRQLDKLVRRLLKDKLNLKASQFFTYTEIFEKHIGINPLLATKDELLAVISKHNIQLYDSTNHLTKDALLDLLMTHLVQPNLPDNVPVFIYDYPETQAALAQIKKAEVNVAERFELYLNGTELANGYQELLDASEQQRRFENENKAREQSGLQLVPVDRNLIAALASGMPVVAGVALGFDRLLMLATGMRSVSDVISFSIDKA